MCAWVHAASISGASRRRRRQSVAAPPSAPAITPPALTPFARFSRSPSVPLPPPFPLRFARSSLSRSRSRFLSLSIPLFFRLRRRCYRHCSLSRVLHWRAQNLRKSSRRHLPSFPVLTFSLSLGGFHVVEESSQEFFCQHGTVSGVSISFSVLLRRHVPGTFRIVGVARFHARDRVTLAVVSCGLAAGGLRDRAPRRKNS